MKEQIRFSNESISSLDWSKYPILRFNEVPDIEVKLIGKPENKGLGVGEASQGPVAAAIANAVVDATGKHIREIPFTPALVLTTLN